MIGGCPSGVRNIIKDGVKSGIKDRIRINKELGDSKTNIARMIGKMEAILMS
jgi:hypothetical protein